KRFVDSDPVVLVAAVDVGIAPVVGVEASASRKVELDRPWRDRTRTGDVRVSEGLAVVLVRAISRCSCPSRRVLVGQTGRKRRPLGVRSIGARGTWRRSAVGRKRSR